MNMIYRIILNIAELFRSMVPFMPTDEEKELVIGYVN